MNASNALIYTGDVSVTINKRHSVTTIQYKNTGTQVLGNLLARLLLRQSVLSSEYPAYIDVRDSGENTSYLNKPLPIISPYTESPTAEQPRLLQTVVFSALLRSVDLRDVEEYSNIEVVLCDGNKVALASVDADGLPDALASLKASADYSITVTWNLNFINGTP